MGKNKVSPLRVIIVIALMALAIISIFIAVQNVEEVEQPSIEEIPPTAPTQVIKFNINGCELWFDSYADGACYDIVTLNSDKPNPIIVGDFSGYRIFVNDKELTMGNATSFDVPKMSINDKVVVKYVETATGVERVNYINTLPPSFTGTQVISNTPEAGYYYFNLDGYVYKMSTDGSIVYWRMAGGADVSIGGNDFKRTDVGGKTFYSFLWGGDSAEYPYLSGVSYGRMQALVLDENYQQYEHIPFMLPTDKIGANCRMTNCQFTVLGDRHYLLTAYIGKIVDNIPDSVPHSAQGVRVTAAIVQEIKNGELIFEWDSSDYPEIYSLNPNADYLNKTEYWTDYLHLNAVVVDPSDNNFVMSFGNADTVVKIDRTSKNVLWKLGGTEDEFGLTQEQKFSGQNDVRITADGALTLFNNGVPPELTNENGKTVFGQSTIMRFVVDENTKKLITFKEYMCESAYSPNMGSAQEITDGHYVIGWGERYTATPLFSEIDFNTNTTKFALLKPNYNGSNLYRVYKSNY